MSTTMWGLTTIKVTKEKISESLSRLFKTPLHQDHHHFGNPIYSTYRTHYLALPWTCNIEEQNISNISVNSEQSMSSERGMLLCIHHSLQQLFVIFINPLILTKCENQLGLSWAKLKLLYQVIGKVGVQFVFGIEVEADFHCISGVGWVVWLKRS